MSANKKLTATIKGRTIKNTIAEASAFLIRFSDGSTMKVKTGTDSPAPEDCSGKEIESVQQHDTAMTLTFTDGSTNDLPLEEATSSVILRDKDNKMEYAD
jgi:hypothetical protein